MIRKLLIIFYTTSLAHAGIISTNYAPATTQVIYDQPELSHIYESVNTPGQMYDFEDGANQGMFSKSFNNRDFQIHEVQITPSSSGSANIQTIYQPGSSQGSVSPSVYTTSAALPKPVSLPSYTIGSSPIIYNRKVTPGLSAYASS